MRAITRQRGPAHGAAGLGDEQISRLRAECGARLATEWRLSRVEMQSGFWGGGRGHADEEGKCAVSSLEGMWRKMTLEKCTGCGVCAA